MIKPLIPVREPVAFESAPGALMRSFSANHVRAREVYKLLKLPWTEYVSRAHLVPLSQVTGFPLAWLRPRVPEAGFEDQWQRGWCGQLWRSPAVIRTCTFQICPRCVHEQGICRLEWDLAFVCACLKHRVVLQERCIHCNRALTWHRPAVDVCPCQRYFRSRGPQLDDLPLLVDSWFRWVVAAIHDFVTPPPLPAELEQLFPGAPSIDGMWRVIHAFGIRPDEGEALINTPPGLSITPAHAFVVTTRGLSRLKRACDGEDVTPLVYARALRWQAKKGVTESDRLLAEFLLKEVLDCPDPRKNSRRVKGEQKGLFE